MVQIIFSFLPVSFPVPSFFPLRLFCLAPLFCSPALLGSFPLLLALSLEERQRSVDLS